MRQFVFGLLVAALAVWGYGSWGRQAEGKTPGGGSDLDLGTVLPAPDARPELRAEPRPEPRPLAAGRESPQDEVQQALADLLERLHRGDAAARQEAQRLLGRADLAPELRSRLQAGLEPAAAAPASASASAPAPAPATPTTAIPGKQGPPEDLDAVMARLGENNAFLHTASGRALGQRAAELIAGMQDEQAIAAATRLLALCMRGDIPKTDQPAHEFVDLAYAQHRVRADRFLCDPANVARARTCTAGKNDTLVAIAARFRKEGVCVEEGTLAVLNRIHNMNVIREGQRIKVPVDPIHAVVEKRSFLMAVYVGDAILRLYWVGHGADDKTPVAEFTVGEKVENPPWYAPDGKVYAFGDPKNILGKYFIKFSHPSYTGFGAHGTPQPETIGTMSSMGCIRMFDKDIEELYRLLPRKAKIEIRDSH